MSLPAGVAVVICVGANLTREELIPHDVNAMIDAWDIPLELGRAPNNPVKSCSVGCVQT
jgi:hypothetical protein